MRTVKKRQHCAYQTHYHFVTPVKYRKAIFGKKDREHSLIEIIKKIEERYEIEFEQVGIDTNHVHYLISAIPRYAPSEIVQIIKSITAREMLRNHEDLKEELWGGELWTDGYYVATIGEGGNRDVIREYVKKQGVVREVKEQLKLFDF